MLLEGNLLDLPPQLLVEIGVRVVLGGEDPVELQQKSHLLVVDDVVLVVVG